ncbi:MAG: hypothetical protein UU22_C0017G0007 [Parcubacteria group bacterium GW2011_GWA2_40_8]|nr:MAG: hypothetical protein UU22_C0017G0007 [Parcubacteria group bacterium GW2011_GWA2_40_8]
MSQAKVPKFIDVQDKVVDGLTIWQVIDLATAGVIAAICFVLLKGAVGQIIAFFAVVVGVCFAFIKVNERPFSVFIMAAFSFVINPKRYSWQKERPKIKIREHKIAPLPARSIDQELTVQKIKALATALDIEENIHR